MTESLECVRRVLFRRAPNGRDRAKVFLNFRVKGRSKPRQLHLGYVPLQNDVSALDRARIDKAITRRWKALFPGQTVRIDWSDVAGKLAKLCERLDALKSPAAPCEAAVVSSACSQARHCLEQTLLAHCGRLPFELDCSCKTPSICQGMRGGFDNGRSRTGMVTLVLRVSRDEETIEARLLIDDRSIVLPSRSFGYLLLYLARARIEDQEQGRPDVGWVDAHECASRLGISPEKLNVDVYRLRTVLRKLGISDAIDIVERRVLTRQLRVGISSLQIFGLV